MSIFNKKKTEAKPAEAKKAVKAAKEEKDDKKASMKDLYKAEAAATEKSKPAEGAEKKKVSLSGNAGKILARPLITEKGSSMNAENKYLFEVSGCANKVEIAKAIEESYGVKPVKVNIMCLDGKKTRRGRFTGKRKDWKKAIVTLPEGSAIKIYEGI